MADRLTILAERLLRAGVAPARVHRYVGELRDHFEDLCAELSAAGLSEAALRAEAWRRLGSCRALALPLLVDRRARSLASRAPWLTFLLLPVLACLGTGALLTLGLMAVAQTPGWMPALPDFGAGAAIFWLVLTLAAAWAVQLAGLLHRAAPTWPLLGAVATIALGGLMQVGITMPAPLEPGAISIAVTQPAPWPLLTLLVLALLPQGAVRLRRLLS